MTSNNFSFPFMLRTLSWTGKGIYYELFTFCRCWIFHCLDITRLCKCDQQVSAAEYKNIKIWPLLNFTLRDFAYVARDNLTQVLKCHVFRCDSPAKNIATSLHEMCSKVSCYRISSCCHAFFSIVYNQQNIFYTKRKCTFILYVVVCR